MSYFNSNYRFLLDGTLVTPVLSNQFSMQWEKEDGYYFRKKLKDNIKLTDTDYNYIREANIDTRFSIVLQKRTGDQWVEYLKGFFYKTDCKFDEDIKTVEVKVRTDDGWDDLKKVINNEYSLPALAPDITPVNYLVRPVLQVMVLNVTLYEGPPTIRPLNFTGGNKVTNCMGGVTWDENLERSLEWNELDDYGFRAMPYAFPDRVVVLYRYLTTREDFFENQGDLTSPRSTNDPSIVPSYYEYTCTPDAIYNNSWLIRIVLTQTEPTSLGLVQNCPSLTGRYYYNYQNIISYYIPVGREFWGCESVWLFFPPLLNNYEIEYSEKTTVRDAYTVFDVIQVLLEQETDIKHLPNINYSEFLYDRQDPIAGNEYTPIITPKSNIVNAFYTEPARKAPIRLSDLMQLYSAIFRVYWHIETVDGEKRFRLEHISWYENGGSYRDQIVDLDLKNTQDKRNLKALDFGQNKFRYDKTKMPQRYEFSYQDDVSDYFNGDPIEILTNEIEQGAIEKEDTKLFNPEVTFLPARPDTALEGFVLLNAELISGEYEVTLTEVAIFNDDLYFIQNASLSYRFLHPAYHRYGLPALNVIINGEQTTALSITRTKQQEIEFAIEDVDIDPLHLVTTSIGSGQVEEMSKNLINNKFEITLNHDTE